MLAGWQSKADLPEEVTSGTELNTKRDGKEHATLSKDTSKEQETGLLDPLDAHRINNDSG